jgi:putative ABC transport system ATP-binding protein
MAGLSAEVVDLTFEVDVPPHGRQTILDIPQLIVAAGRMAAIAGPSGSGKSTLLYLLAGLLVPQRGQVLWAGSDLAKQGEAQRDRWRLHHAGFIFQSFNLVDELSPLDNVLLPAWFANIGVRDKRDRAKALLRQFGVPDVTSRVALLSRGEQQRVAVARALLFDPKVIFADEPTASLDAAAGVLIAQELRRLASEDGRTVIVASHDRAVLDVADRVVTLERGRIVTSAAVMAA